MRVVFITVVTLSAACSDSTPAPATQRTPEQQRTADSSIGASRLPGAGGVNKALAASDSAAARNLVLDSIAKTP